MAAINPLYTVPCSGCGADVREPCRSKRGTWVRPHKPRRNAYEEATDHTISAILEGCGSLTGTMTGPEPVLPEYYCTRCGSIETEDDGRGITCGECGSRGADIAIGRQEPDPEPTPDPTPEQRPPIGYSSPRPVNLDRSSPDTLVHIERPADPMANPWTVIREARRSARRLFWRTLRRKARQRTGEIARSGALVAGRAILGGLLIAGIVIGSALAGKPTPKASHVLHQASQTTNAIR